ncbi:MAG: carboxypeptidase regulatory-like domain-containing protein [Chitinispirillaceae bacterium]
MAGKKNAVTFLFSAAFIFSVQSVQAQEVNLSGNVRDGSGAAISGAEVTLQSNTSVTATTGSQGEFTLSGHTNPIISQKISWHTPSATLSGSHVVVNINESSPINVTIHSIAGKKITDFSTGKLDAGIHTISLPTSSLGAGTYMVAVDHENSRSVLKYISSSRNASHLDKSLSSSSIRRNMKVVAAGQNAVDTILVSAEGYTSAAHPVESHNQSDIVITLESTGTGSRLDNITKSCGNLMPSPVSGGQNGWGSRYWDCCKPHCSWPDNTSNLSANCDVNNEEMPCYEDMGDYLKGTDNGCQGGPAFTCYNHVPFAVCENLAYAFAAVPSGGDACGKCFQLDFDGGFEHGDPKEAHQLMAGKTMIVIASNIGHDVGGGQFDIMIPGGGLGAFTGGCEEQWGINLSDESLVGKTYGGFTSKCEEQLGFDASVGDMKVCVRQMCDNLFGNDPKLADLHEGCIWYVEWMHAVNNPTFQYKEVPCPQELIDLYYTTKH